MVIKITLKHSIFQWSLIHVEKLTSMINSNGSCQVLVWCVVAIGMRAGSNTNKYPTHWDWYSYCIINSPGEPKLGEWCKVKGAGVRAWETIFIKWLKDYMFAQVTCHSCTIAGGQENSWQVSILHTALSWHGSVLMPDWHYPLVLLLVKGWDLGNTTRCLSPQ